MLFGLFINRFIGLANRLRFSFKFIEILVGQYYVINVVVDIIFVFAVVVIMK